MTAWRPVPGFPAYEIDAWGRVRSVATHYVLTPRRGIVALSRDGRAHRCAVRDLAASAWAETPAGRPQAAPAADEKDAEIARLRGVVAELEAEMAVYRVSAGL